MTGHRPYRTARMRREAHDPGDPLITSHCPFCGSGQVVGRSDGTIGCDFCGQAYIVRVQPAFPGTPQMPGPGGAASDIGPDGAPMDPGMVGPDGMPMGGGMPGDDAGDGAPPFGGDDEAAEGADAPDGEGGPPPPPGGKSDDSGPKPPPKGKGKKKESSYRGLGGQPLNEDQYVRHLAASLSGYHPQVMAALRATARSRTAAVGFATPDQMRRHLTDHHGDDVSAVSDNDLQAEHDIAHGYPGSGARGLGNFPFPHDHKGVRPIVTEGALRAGAANGRNAMTPARKGAPGRRLPFARTADIDPATLGDSPPERLLRHLHEAHGVPVEAAGLGAGVMMQKHGIPFVNYDEDDHSLHALTQRMQGQVNVHQALSYLHLENGHNGDYRNPARIVDDHPGIGPHTHGFRDPLTSYSFYAQPHDDAQQYAEHRDDSRVLRPTLWSEDDHLLPHQVQRDKRWMGLHPDRTDEHPNLLVHQDPDDRSTWTNLSACSRVYSPKQQQRYAPPLKRDDSDWRANHEKDLRAGRICPECGAYKYHHAYYKPSQAGKPTPEFRDEMRDQWQERTRGKTAPLPPGEFDWNRLSSRVAHNGETGEELRRHLLSKHRLSRAMSTLPLPTLTRIHRQSHGNPEDDGQWWGSQDASRMPGGIV